MSVQILTFGCRLNAYESEVIRAHTAHLTDTIIVNTCAVTAEAERQARQAIRRVRREHPDSRIVVTGCAAQINPERWARLPGVALETARRVCAAVARLRETDLYKLPGVGETITWARALSAVGDLDATLGAALKVKEDVERVRASGVLSGA